MSQTEIQEIRNEASDLALDISKRIRSLYTILENNFDDCFNYEKSDTQFPVYDFEMRQHHDTYRMFSERLASAFNGETDGS